MWKCQICEVKEASPNDIECGFRICPECRQKHITLCIEDKKLEELDHKFIVLSDKRYSRKKELLESMIPPFNQEEMARMANKVE